MPVMEPQNNASPLLLVEHKLGMELWSVRLLYRYAYSRLLLWRDRTLGFVFIDAVELNNLSRAVLLINPDCYTAWNIRKEMIENNDLSMAGDLMLGQLILTKFPKSAETFIHRRWLFQRLVNQCLSSSNDSSVSAEGSQQDNSSILLSMDSIDIALGSDANGHASGNRGQTGFCLGESGKGKCAALPLESSRLLSENLHRELSVCEHAADNYASNYYAWTHRAWIVQYCFNCSLQILLRELERTQTWCMKHVSDHSGFHYRQFLLSSISQHAIRLHRHYAMSVCSLVDSEHQIICDLIHAFPAHEAMWYHRKFVFHLMMTSAKNQNIEVAPVSHVLNGEVAMVHGAVCKNEGQKRSRIENHSPHILRQRELDAVQKTMGQSKDTYQKTLATKYLDWLDRMFPLCKEA